LGYPVHCSPQGWRLLKMLPPLQRHQMLLQWQIPHSPSLHLLQSVRQLKPRQWLQQLLQPLKLHPPKLKNPK
jgi:hypothetical protein